MQEQYKGTIYIIKSEALLQRIALLKEIKTDVKTCHTEFFLHKSEMLTKAQRLKEQIDAVQNDLMDNVFSKFDFKHRCSGHKITINRHIARLQRYVHKYDQPAITSLQFLSCIKADSLPQIHLTLHTSQLFMTESFDKEDVSNPNHGERKPTHRKSLSAETDVCS